VKKLWLVTSCALLDKNTPFKGTATRSFYTNEQRIEQTLETLKSVQVLDSAADIMLLDTSANKIQEFLDFAQRNPNVYYIHLADLSADAALISRTHTSKSHCEANMLVELFKHYRKQILDYDFVIKISARYQFDKNYFNLDYFNDINLDKFLSLKEINYPRQQAQHMENLRPYNFLYDDRVRGLKTVAYGVGKKKLIQWEYLMALCCQYTKETSSMYWLDIEYILHHLMHEFNLLTDVVETTWQVIGNCGITGRKILC